MRVQPAFGLRSTKLMQIELSNRDRHYLRILDCAGLRTITVIVRYSSQPHGSKFDVRVKLPKYNY